MKKRKAKNSNPKLKIIRNVLCVLGIMILAAGMLSNGNDDKEKLLSEKPAVVQEEKSEVSSESSVETEKADEQTEKDKEKSEEETEETEEVTETKTEEVSESKTEENTTQKTEEKTEVLGELKVHFIDVGQADAILISQGENHMMIDAGNNADSDLILEYLRSKGVNKLQYIIGTHPHEDHIGGMDSVINSIEVDKVIMPKIIHTTKTFKDVMEAVKGKGLKITAPLVEEEYSLGKAKWIVLAPNSSEYDELNDYSVVIKLSFGESDFIFTGDAEEISENKILKSGINIDAEVLKVGHHGSDSSTSEKFLDTITPEYAILSVGKENKYGHPTKDTMNKLKIRGINVYRTDENGTIVCSTDGEQIIFNKEPGTYNYHEEKPVEKPVEETKDEPVENKDKEESIKKGNGVIIESIDKKKEIVTIYNDSSEEIDITGWTLFSALGEQEYTFPSYILKANERITVVSGKKSQGTLEWTKRYVWNDKENDEGILRDRNGKTIFLFDDK